jgi:hypothetical protein
MKTVSHVAIILSLVMLASLMICGLWIRFSGQPIDDSSIKFHMTLGIATSAVIFVTFTINWIVGRTA